MVLQWVPPSSPSLQTCLWKSEVKALSSAPHPHTWLWFVDTFVIQGEDHSQQHLQHINTQDPNIEFTMEEPNQDGLLPFLHTRVSPGPNNTLITTAYRKSTHADQYLHWVVTTSSGLKTVFSTHCHTGPK